jgi:hypothetical protein
VAYLHFFNRFKTDGNETGSAEGVACGPTSTSSSIAIAAAAAATAGGVSIQQQQQHQQYLGDMSAALPDFGQIGLHADQLPSGLTADHVSVFEKMYRDHCEVRTK